MRNAETWSPRVIIPGRGGALGVGPSKGPEETPHTHNQQNVGPPVSYLDPLLPWEKRKLFFGRLRPTQILFPLPGAMERRHPTSTLQEPGDK